MSSDAQPVVLTCPTCNAPLDYDGIHSVVRCKFCGNTSIVPASAEGQRSTALTGLEEIKHLCEQGDFQAAVARFQALFGTDINEAQVAVRAIQQGHLEFSTSLSGRDNAELEQGMQSVQRLALEQNKLEAIKLYRQLFDVGLEQAKTAVDQIANWGQTQTPPPTYPSLDQFAAPRKSKAGWIAALTVFLIAAATGIFLWFGGVFKEHYNTIQTDVLLSPSDQTAPKIAAMMYDPYKENWLLGLVNTDPAKLLWKVSANMEGGTQFASLSDRLFVANKTTLKALSQTDGSILWQTEMSDVLDYADSPMLVSADRLIVATTDRKLAAYDTASGEQLWTRPLAGYDSNLRLLGNTLVLRDNLPDSYDQGLFLINVENGSEKTLAPVCSANDRTDALDNDSAILLDPQDQSVILIFSQGCVQKIRLADQTMLWNTFADTAFSQLYSGYAQLATTDAFYVGLEGRIVSIGRAEGDLKTLIDEEDYDLLPLAKSGDILLVRAKRTRGSSRFELWGVNVVSGSPQWKMNLQEDEPIDPPDQMAGLIDDTDHGWTWHVEGQTLTLFTFSGEPNQLTVESFNLADGLSQNKKTYPLKHVSGDFYGIPKVVGWNGSLVYLDIETNLYLLDLNSGELKVIF